MPDVPFGTWLKQRRRAFDLTQGELARRVGCSIDTIYRYEAGTRRPSKQVAASLAEALDISAGQMADFLRLARVGHVPADEASAEPLSEPRAIPTAASQMTTVPVRRAGSSAFIPLPTNVLVGREQEAAEVRARLLRDDVRLLTLVGPAGVGKTRLSLEVAVDLLDSFEDGVYFVALADLGDIDLVACAIARMLGVKEAAGETVTDRLRQFLRDRHMLLILDNFEQVVVAAPLVADLLGAGARFKVLVTSREALQLRSEWLFDLDGLDYPIEGSTTALEAFSAIRLFAQRAQQMQRHWQLSGDEAQGVVRICRLVEGLPLAIELAAATVRERSCVEIAHELEHGLRALAATAHDVPLRHQSMWAALEHSWQLLNPEERLLLPRLAIFRGGFHEEAAAEVGGASPHDLETLVAKSLLRQMLLPDGSRRYQLHELVRQYAENKLEHAGASTATQDRHLDYFLDLAETAEGQLIGPDQTQWLVRLEREHDNLRVALRWTFESRQGSLALRLTAALERFWYLHGDWSEGRAWLTQALASTDASDVSVVHGRALIGAGELADCQSDYAAAIALFEQSEALFRKLGDTLHIAHVQKGMAHVAHNQQDFEWAQRLWEQALPVFREYGDIWRIGLSLHGLGYVLLHQGQVERAVQLFEEGLVCFRIVGSKGSLASSLMFLGRSAYQQGDFGRALTLCEEALALNRETGSKHGLAWSLRELGSIAQAMGEPERAEAYIGESLQVRWDLRDAHGSAWALEGLAEVACARQQPERAARLWGQAESLREAFGVALTPEETAPYAVYVAAARAQRDAAQFEAAWVAGRGMTLEDAVAYALAGSNHCLASGAPAATVLDSGS